MTPLRLLLAGAATAVAVLVVVGLSELGGSKGASPPARLTRAQIEERLAGSPPALAALHAQAGTLLGGGLRAIRSRLNGLRGRPVVVNKWASWCVPCRGEFGILQAVSVARGRQVAFLGIDSGDSSRAKPEAFLRSFPVAYPSYFDPSQQAGEALTESSFTPVTLFINSRGRTYVRQGAYPSVAKLEADVERYALGG